MADQLQIGRHTVGRGCPCYVVAEIGINHNGDIKIARQLIAEAKRAGCQAVKFQKRTPEACVPFEQRSVIRPTPWGQLTNLEYRRQIEFGRREYDEIDDWCRHHGLDWFASCWDCESVEFIERYNPPAHKIASACLTDHELLDRIVATGRPAILSTGMSTPDEIAEAVDHFDAVMARGRLALLHCTSTYPCPADELNLDVIRWLRKRYDCPVGYSGHELGLATTVAAVALGACIVERHFTLDRSMPGSDQAASVEPQGMARLVRDIRAVEQAIGDGVKRVYDSELPAKRKLRRA